MKFIITGLILLITSFSYGQIEKIIVPEGIVYHYCNDSTIETSKRLIRLGLSDSSHTDLAQRIMIVGPVLWDRFKKIHKLAAIEGGNTTFHVNNNDLYGKMSQRVEDSKSIWNEFRKEMNGQKYTIRKANEQELRYYWSVISFDIDEPLLIVETQNHNYILNILKDEQKLMWLDEYPK